MRGENAMGVIIVVVGELMSSKECCGVVDFQHASIESTSCPRDDAVCEISGGEKT